MTDVLDSHVRTRNMKGGRNKLIMLNEQSGVQSSPTSFLGRAAKGRLLAEC